ncbi:MAG: hypothetical protein U0527_05555 [Candidatus Eisenbacteria bacterium]
MEDAARLARGQRRNDPGRGPLARWVEQQALAPPGRGELFTQECRVDLAGDEAGAAAQVLRVLLRRGDGRAVVIDPEHRARRASVGESPEPVPAVEIEQPILRLERQRHAHRVEHRRQHLGVHLREDDGRIVQLHAVQLEPQIARAEEALACDRRVGPSRFEVVVRPRRIEIEPGRFDPARAGEQTLDQELGRADYRGLARGHIEHEREPLSFATQHNPVERAGEG